MDTLTSLMHAVLTAASCVCMHEFNVTLLSGDCSKYLGVLYHLTFNSRKITAANSVLLFYVSNFIPVLFLL